MHTCGGVGFLEIYIYIYNKNCKFKFFLGVQRSIRQILSCLEFIRILPEYHVFFFYFE